MELFNLKTQTPEEVSDDQAEGLAIGEDYAKPNDVLEMWNYQTNAPEMVKTSEAPKRIWDNTHNFIEGKKVPIIDQGEIRELDPVDAFKKIKEEGAFVPSGDELDQHRYSDPLRSAGIGALDALSSLPFAAQKAMERINPHAGPDKMGEIIGNIEEASRLASEIDPTAHALGEVAGLVSSPEMEAVSFVGRGVAKGVSKMIAKDAVKGLARKSLESAAKMGAQFAVEGAALQGDENVKNILLHDKDFTLDNITANMGPSALIGGGIGAGLGISGQVLKAGANKVSKALGGRIAKAAEASGNQIEYVDSPISASQLKKERLLHDPTKFATKFEADPETAGAYVYKDKNKIAYIDPAKIPGKILDYGNQQEVDALVDAASKDQRVKSLVDPKKLKTGFVDEVIDAALATTDEDYAVIRYLQANKKTQRVGNLLKRLRDSTRRIEEGSAIPADITSARKISAQLDEVLKLTAKTGDAYLDATISGVKRNRDRYRNILVQEVREAYDGVVGFKEGNKLFLLDVGDLPDEAILKGMQKYRRPVAPLGEGYNAILRHLGATKADIRKFEESFNAEERKAAEVFLKQELKKASGKYSIPSHEVLLSNFEQANQVAKQGMDSAASKMENELFDTYAGAAPERIGLKGSSVAKKIRQLVQDELYDPATNTIREGASGVVDKLEDYAKSWEGRVLPSGRELPFTLSEWRERRINLDKSIERFFGRDNIPLDKEQMLKLRNWMESKITDAAQEHLPGDIASPLLQEYNDSKLLYRMTNTKKKAASLYNFTKNGIASDMARSGVPIVASGVGGVAAGILGGGVAPGLLGAAASGAAADLYKGNKYYAKYLMHDKLLPWMQSSWNGMTRGARGFSNRYGGRIVTTSMALSINDSDVKYLEKNKDKIKLMVENPSVYTDNIGQSHPELEQLSPGLGVELARKGYNALSFIYGKMPKTPYPPESQIKWEPSKLEQEKFKRYVNATMYPNSIFQHFGEGYISNEESEVLKTVYPGMYNRFKAMVFDKLRDKPLSIDQRSTLKRVFGVDWGYKPPPQQAIQQQDAQNEQAAAEKTRKVPGRLSGSTQTENERLQDK